MTDLTISPIEKISHILSLPISDESVLEQLRLTDHTQTIIQIRIVVVVVIVVNTRQNSLIVLILSSIPVNPVVRNS